MTEGNKINEMTEIQNKLYIEIEEDIETLITYKFRGQLRIIRPDDNPDYINDLFNQKNIFIVCFDDSKEVLKELKQTKIPYKILPCYYYDEFDTVLMKMSK